MEKRGCTVARLVAVALVMVAIAYGWVFQPALAYAALGDLTEDRQEGLLVNSPPLYSQLDNPGTEWTSCGPTSLAMALNYQEYGTTPQVVIDYATSQTGADGELLYKPDDPAGVFTSPQHLFELAQHYGAARMGWVTEPREAQATLRELLSKNLPVIVDVTVPIRANGSTSAHFVVVTGIGVDGRVYVHDPYGQGSGGQIRSVSWDDFYWAWQNNSDGSVGGHGWWLTVKV